MIKSFTTKHLIQFIYGELSFENTAKLYDAFEYNQELEDELQEIINVKEYLDNSKMIPRESINNKILEYSKEQGYLSA